uniref:Protein kinase domain-containing protein n=1 Tax=Glossina palpalis gambiensis TaxID=67801 RepID=A0A1B0BV57_9MUSC
MGPRYYSMAIACNLLQERSLVESELKLLLLHAAQRLRYKHSNDLVHLDLKSENIFFPKVPAARKTPMLLEHLFRYRFVCVLSTAQKCYAAAQASMGPENEATHSSPATAVCGLSGTFLHGPPHVLRGAWKL